MEVHDVQSAFFVNLQSAVWSIFDDDFLMRDAQFCEELHVRKVVLVVVTFGSDVDQNRQWCLAGFRVGSGKIVSVVARLEDKLVALAPVVL